jgi:stage II sporulation protein D
MKLLTTGTFIAVSLILLFGTSLTAYVPLSQKVFSLPLTPKAPLWLTIRASSTLKIVPATADYPSFSAPLCISKKKSKLSINGHPVTTGSWYLLPSDNTFFINHHRYEGPATLQLTRSHLTVWANQSTGFSKNNIWEGYSPPEHHYHIKALIHETPHPSTIPVLITATQGFIVQDPYHKLLSVTDPNFTVAVTHTPTALVINGKPTSHTKIKLIAKGGSIYCNGKQFHGSLTLFKEGNRLLFINHVDLEEYVYCVLKTESWPGWPLEVNKAFAIACRSYALATMKKAQQAKQPYHIKNTKEHQTYQGMHTNQELRGAVEQTKGMFLMYNTEPALAMFDCCCGGIIPAHVEQVDFDKAPYLARTYACTHCKRCAIYSWKKEVSLTELQHHVGHLLKKTTPIKDIKISKKDKAGIVHELQLTQGGEWCKISAKQLYGAFKGVKSFYFTLHRKKHHLTFQGRGFGHHLGMCQWGAREMVRDGWPYTRILNFYYPGTTLVKLT